jgi:hypothetical protein
MRPTISYFTLKSDLGSYFGVENAPLGAEE